MEAYDRILRKVRGAMWAHHRRLMPERQFQRILGYVYSHKYEYQIRFDQMECVGTELDGKVEVTITPAGYLKGIRADPSVEDLPTSTLYEAVLSAYSRARAQGDDLMARAELNIYKHFLRDLKPLVTGIRDNPEFYTISPHDRETPYGTIRAAPGNRGPVARTIPFSKAYRVQEEWAYRKRTMDSFLATPDGRRWLLTATGKTYGAQQPENRPRGAPGMKKSVPPLDLPVPYMSMDEDALRKRNWVAYFENCNVAQRMWTRAQAADRMTMERQAQREGKAWHYDVT